MRHKRDPIHVFQPPLVAIFVDAPSCPLRTETGLKPVVYRIERWTMKVTVRPIETKIAFRVIAAPDAKKITLDLSACGHPDGCSIVNGLVGVASRIGPADATAPVGAATIRRRSLFGQSDRSGETHRVSSEYSFADDMSTISAVSNVGDSSSACVRNETA